MDSSTFDEIISTLAKCGRPDLIHELRELEFKIVDNDYDPAKDKGKYKKEPYSDSEGSDCEDEDLDFTIDEDGFHSLKGC